MVETVQEQEPALRIKYLRAGYEGCQKIKGAGNKPLT